MADKKISDLVDGGLPQPTDDFVVARAGTNNKIAWSSMSGGGGNGAAVTISGNTAGAGALVSTGTLSLAGGNAITLSQAGNAITIVGPSLTESQTFIAGISASDTLYTSGTVRITGVGGGVTVGSNTGQRIDISVAAQSVQPETQTFIGGISASNTLYTSGSVRFTGSQAVTVRSGTGQLVVIDVPAQTAQTFVGAIVGSNATYTSGTVTFTGVGGGVTVSSNTGQRVDISVAAPVAQTNQAGSVYASSNTFGTSSGTFDARTLSIAGRGEVSVAASNSGWIISSPVQTNQAGTVYASSNTFGTSSGTYDARTLSIAGSGAVSVAASNSGWVVSAPVQTNQSGNVYASSNTFGTSSGTYDARSISMAGSGGVSVAASNSGWVVSGPATSSLSATGQVSIAANASTLSIGVPNPLLSYRWIEDLLQMGATQGIATSGASNTTVSAWVQPVSVPVDLAFNNVYLAAQNSFSSATTSISSVNYSYSMGASLGFYTLNVSTMSLVTSFSASLGYSNATAANATNMSLTARVGFGGSSTTKSTQGAANMTNIMSSIEGVRKIPMNWTTISNTLTRGQYWAVAAFSQLTGGAANGSLTSVGFVSNYSAIGSALNPPDLMGNTASVTSPYPFLGMATLVNSSNQLMPVSFNTSKVTTATAIANSTAFQSIWMNLYSSHQT